MKNRKLNYSLPIIAIYLLSGCNSKTNSNQLTIVVPQGAPSIAFYNYAGKNNFTTNSDPSNIIPLMISEQVDIAVLPTNAGVQAINGKHVNYKLAATITFGNVFVASTGNDTTNGVMDPTDYIVSFQQGSVPDKIFHAVYGNTLDSAINYVSSAALAAQALKLGKNAYDENKKVDYVVLAQPALYSVLSTTEGREVYADLQALYNDSHEGQEIFQASIFVKSKLDNSVIDSFLNNIKEDITRACENPNLIVEGMTRDDDAEATFGIKPSLAKDVTLNGNGMGLGFKLARENKSAIDTFLEALGIGETNEEIYY